jgi:hypothetical protein
MLRTPVCVRTPPLMPLQMAIVLSLESVDELMAYWGDDTGHITWRLTPPEVRSLLAQRPDFAREAIDALQL